MNLNFLLENKNLIKYFQLYISYLPQQITNKDIYQIFQIWAPIKNLKISKGKDRLTYGFLQFYNFDEMFKVLKQAQGMKISQNIVEVLPSRNCVKICNYCHGFGHWKGDCNTKRCYGCGQNGHLLKDCNKYESKNQTINIQRQKMTKQNQKTKFIKKNLKNKFKQNKKQQKHGNFQQGNLNNQKKIEQQQSEHLNETIYTIQPINKMKTYNQQQIQLQFVEFMISQSKASTYQLERIKYLQDLQDDFYDQNGPFVIFRLNSQNKLFDF